LYNKNNNNFLPIKKVIEVLEQAKEMQKVSYVAVTGGDPIEHPDLPELIKYLEQNNIFMIYLQKL
jgi:organic radical activating enzyme